MPTRNELIFQFMISLAANGSVQATDASYVYRIASELADEYLKNQTQFLGESTRLSASHTECKYPTSKGIIMKKVIIVISVLGLGACSSAPTAPTHVPMGINAPVVTLHYDAQVQQMSRQEVIQATMDCESAGMRASPIMSKRKVSGMLSDIIIDIQCIPRYRVF